MRGLVTLADEMLVPVFLECALDLAHWWRRAPRNAARRKRRRHAGPPWTCRCTRQKRSHCCLLVTDALMSVRGATRSIRLPQSEKVERASAFVDEATAIADEMQAAPRRSGSFRLELPAAATVAIPAARN